MSVSHKNISIANATVNKNVFSVLLNKNYTGVNILLLCPCI